MNQTIKVTIGGLPHSIALYKYNKMVFCSISVAGVLSANRNDVNDVIPTDYCPVTPVYLTAKNVTVANYGNNYGSTRYEISKTGNITIVTNEKGSVERSASGCWFTN